MTTPSGTAQPGASPNPPQEPPPAEPTAAPLAADAEPSAPVQTRPPRTVTDTGQFRLLPSQLAPVVHDGLTPSQLNHPSAMVPRLGMWLRLFAKIFFSPVQFAPRLTSEIATHAKEGAIVYTLHSISLLDYLYFNYALLRGHAPIAKFANGVSTTFFQPWRRVFLHFMRRFVLRRPSLPDPTVMRAHLRRRNAVLLFLRQGFSLLDFVTPRPQVPYLRELIEAQREVDFPIIVLPQVLVWHRNPEKSRTSIIDEFFGDPQAPGRLRKLFSFLLNFRRAFVQGGQPVDVRAFLEDEHHITDDALLAEVLRVRITASFKAEQRIICGVPTKPVHQVTRELLEDAEVAADLRQFAEQQQRPIEALQAEAFDYIREIAANFQMWLVSTLCFVLTLLWARIYDGIEVDEEGLESIREEGRKHPVVLVPSHKSHADYLLLSYLFYRNGLIPPHIAAGANLSFFPLGSIFRRGGAFFLRRSFAGLPVYAAIFRHYVRKLLRDGHWLEFFPEGGRSRTGKLLPPKLGLLNHVLEAVADGTVQDVALMPANFGYERLIEGDAYRKELEGGEKKTESVGNVLKATSVLVHKYGRIRIQFGKAIHARDFLEQHGALGKLGERDAKAFERAVKVCGYKILGAINDAAVITPTALVAAVLLTKVQRGISRGDLLTRVGYLLDEASQRHAVLSGPLQTALSTRRQLLVTADMLDQARTGAVLDPLGEHPSRARLKGEAVAEIVDKVLTMFEKPRWVVRRAFEGEDVFVVKRAGRLHLDYYKNNVIHLFVPDALLSASLLALMEQTDGVAPDDLADTTKFLSRLLKFEFIYPPDSFQARYDQTLDRMLAEAWVVPDPQGRLHVTPTVLPVLRLYAKLLQNFIESYALMARGLRALASGPMTDKAFLDYVQVEASKAFELGDVQCWESVSKVNLSNALKIFVELGFVTQTTEGVGKKRAKMLRLKAADDAHEDVDLYVKRVRAFQSPWRIDK
jgi:glycerol-3-phosphate O-acyltransferase